MTQTERIKIELRSAGANGVCSSYFIASFMPRAAARIDDLKGEGFVISSERCTDAGHSKYCRYRLVSEPPATQLVLKVA